MQVSASSYAQKITINAQKASLETVLKQIRSQSGYDILFGAETIKKAKPVYINIKNSTLAEALEASLKDQALTYSISNRTVVITEKEKSVIEVIKDKISSFNSNPSLVTGMVTDGKGTPLAGANVLIKRTKLGTKTDAKGVYLLTTAERNDTLVFSYIGHKTIYKSIKGETIINVELIDAMNGLDEVVVQAYGTTTQRSTTGSIGTLSAVEIAKMPIMDPLLALQGRVPGLVVSRTTGYEGGPLKIEIRGRNAINPGFVSDPLYIIDGVPQTVLSVNGTIPSRSGASLSTGLDLTGMSKSGSQNPLLSLNPADISSIEVLKDADATAIYGSRGANGVILITTKKGSSTKSFSTNVSRGINYITREWPMLNTAQYLEYRREALKNDQKTEDIVNSPDLLNWDLNRYTNWQKYAYGGTGTFTNINTDMSGGNNLSSYRIGAGYTNSKDITVISGGNPRFTLSSNLSTHSVNQKFNMSLTTNYSYGQSNQVNANYLSVLPPNAPDIFDSAGNLNYAAYRPGRVNFPAAELLDTYNSKTNLINSSLSLNYTILKGLVARVNLGYNNSHMVQTALRPIAGKEPLPVPRPSGSAENVGSASFGNGEVSNVVIEPQLEYSRLIAKGTLTLLLGGTGQSNTTKGLVVNGNGYINDALLSSITNAVSITSADNYGQYKYAGVFGRVGYDWENKYFINISGRRDGSSRFGPGNQIGNFGSIGAAWIMSEEKWIKNSLPSIISFIKLRGSYGVTGSDAVGDYQYITQWGNSKLDTYNGVVALIPLNQKNDDFHWQVNRKLETNLSLGFFQDRLSMNASYYSNQCNNQLLSFPTPQISGFPIVTANTPANVRNSGFEFSMDGRIFEGKDFGWTTSFNFSMNKNKLIGYADIENSPYANKLRVGQSLNDFYVFHYEGINPATGEYMYTDWNKDGIIKSNESVFYGTANDDRYVAISTGPKYYGGMNHIFRYKGLQLSAFFSFAKQMGTSATLVPDNPTDNISVYNFENRWRYPGQTDAKVARFTTVRKNSDDNFSSSDGAWTDASYIRLQTLAFSYALPPKVLSFLKMRGLSLNTNAQDVFVITPYKGLDPETQSFGSMPPKKTFTLGLSASL